MLGSSSADHLEILPAPIVSLSKTYADGYVSQRHQHTRVQIMHAITGLMLAETAGANWAVPAGYGLIIPPETPHQTRMVGEVELRSIYISTADQVAGPRPLCRIIAMSELLSALVLRLCQMDNRDDGTDRVSHLTQLILLELADAPDAPLALPFPQSDGLRDVCARLLADPSILQGIDHWAEQCGMSRSTFTRAFRRETGLSFDAWRQRLRCLTAREYIARGSSLARAARAVGYSSPYTLKRVVEKLL